MSDSKYVRWDAKGVEEVQPGEEEKIWEVAEQFKRMQMMNFNEHHHCLRGTHLKTQGVRIACLAAREWEVLINDSVSWANSLSRRTSHLTSPKACSRRPARTTVSCATVLSPRSCCLTTRPSRAGLVCIRLDQILPS
jgi:hypothetical protein